MNRRARFNKKPNTTFSLNINSMTDMFTIMLVFLLQTYSTNSFDVTPIQNLRMPTSVTEKTPEEAPLISFSKEALILNKQNLITTKDFVIDNEYLEQGEIIKPLLSGLQAIKQEKKDKDEVILQLDKDCPYPKMKQILSTASLAGFIKVRLATVSAN